MVPKFRAYMPESMVVFLRWNSSGTVAEQQVLES